MKHAVLVMGHGNLSIMEKYLKILDDERFDFYVHIDAKSLDDGHYLKNICKKSKVFLQKEFLYIGDIIVKHKQK